MHSIGVRWCIRGYVSIYMSVDIAMPFMYYNINYNMHLCIYARMNRERKYRLHVYPPPICVIRCVLIFFIVVPCRMHHTCVISSAHIYTCTCTDTHMRSPYHLSLYLFVRYICMVYIHTYIMYTYTYTYMNIHTYIHACIHTYIHICIHIHTS